MRFSSDVDTGSNYPGAQLFFVSLEQIAYQTFIETLADHDKPELIVVTEVDQIAVNDPRAGLLYYLAGWLLFRVKRYALNTDMGAQSDFANQHCCRATYISCITMGASPRAACGVSIR